MTRLRYPHPPEAGTIVVHRPDASPDVRYRFLKIDEEGFLHLADGYVDVYPQSQMGNTHSPRSIVEHYILRRTHTPYGYAKVWGYTLPCTEFYIPLSPPSATVLAGPPVPLADRCAAWWRTRHPDPTEDRPVGREYIKKVQSLYKEMSHNG
jgi:hypothetical protein